MHAFGNAVFQCLERLVLDGPSATGGAHDGCHLVPVEQEVGDPREPFPVSVRVGLLVMQHVDLQVEVRVVERQPVVPFEAVHGAGLPVALLPCLFRVAGLEPAEQQFVVARLRAEDEAEILLFQKLDVRAVGCQRILDDDRLHVWMLPAKVVQEPLRRVPLAVVLHAAVPAADLVGGMVAGAVDGDQEMAVEHGPVPQNLSALKGGMDPREAAAQVAGAAKDALGAVVTLEAGKITSEGLGEVQEMIDICDFAVGLSRQLYGLSIAPERPAHRIMKTRHPMGPCGVITEFNFPVAVWSWNATLALICGNPVIWKPSEKTPLTALAFLKILGRALARFGDAPDGLIQLVVGGPEFGEVLVGSRDVPIVSATGSTRMGGIVGPKVVARWGRPILELGGNNAMIVAPSADLDMAVWAIVFSGEGTAAPRCAG